MGRDVVDRLVGEDVIVNLVGVLDDGSPLAPGVPLDPRTTLRSEIGESFLVNVRVLYPNGRIAQLKPPTVVQLTLKKSPDGQKVFLKTAAIVNNVATFSGIPHDTKTLVPGLYVYDVWIDQGGNQRFPVVALSNWILGPTVTPVP